MPSNKSATNKSATNKSKNSKTINKTIKNKSIDLNVPLEMQSKKFEEIDNAQKDLICKNNALDLVLIENANEIFRMFMQEGKDNHNINAAMELIGTSNKNCIYLQTETFDIVQDDEDEDGDPIWNFTENEENSDKLKEYIDICSEIIEDEDIDENTIIYTVIGLNLGDGGHYGAIIYDVSEKKIYVFDSMSGSTKEETEYTNSGTEKIFIKVATRLFLGDENYNGIENIETDDFQVEPVYVDYFLQPTGGFEEFLAPVLRKLEKANERKKDKKQKELIQLINLQHTESQNHFCYIWSIWFCNIYLIGGMNKFNDIVSKISKDKCISLIIIKKYILGLVHLLSNEDKINLNVKMEYKEFFDKKFPQIWSNHENKYENKYELYNIKWKKPRNIKQCLDFSYENFIISKIKKTKNIDVMQKLECN